MATIVVDHLHYRDARRTYSLPGRPLRWEQVCSCGIAFSGDTPVEIDELFDRHVQLHRGLVI